MEQGDVSQSGSEDDLSDGGHDTGFKHSSDVGSDSADASFEDGKRSR